MNISSYQIINKCPICGAKVFVPNYWIGRARHKLRPLPIYPTCQHRDAVRRIVLIGTNRKELTFSEP